MAPSDAGKHDGHSPNDRDEAIGILLDAAGRLGPHLPTAARALENLSILAADIIAYQSVLPEQRGLIAAILEAAGRRNRTEPLGKLVFGDSDSLAVIAERLQSPGLGRSYTSGDRVAHHGAIWRQGRLVEWTEQPSLNAVLRWSCDNLKPHDPEFPDDKAPVIGLGRTESGAWVALDAARFFSWPGPRSPLRPPTDAVQLVNGRITSAGPLPAGIPERFEDPEHARAQARRAAQIMGARLVVHEPTGKLSP